MALFQINTKDGRAFQIESEQEPSEDQVLEAINDYTAQGYQAAPKAEGMLATAGRELASGALPALGTVGGAIAGATAGAGAGPVGAVAGDIAGGYAGGQVGQGLMRVGMGELEFRRNLAQLEANRATNPHSAEVGGFIPTIASTLGGAKGLTAAGREATALGKAAPMGERLLENAVSGARMDASLSGQRENLGEDTNLLTDTARGALANGVVGFLPHADSVARSLGKGLGDAALMTIAGEMFDAVKEGRAPSSENIYEKTGESIPAFVLMNGVMSAVGGHPLMKGRAKAAEAEVPTAFEPTKLNEEMQRTFESVKAEEDAKVAQHAANVDNQVQQATTITEQTLANPDLPEAAKEALAVGQQKMTESARTKVQQFALERQTEAQKRFEEMFPEQAIAPEVAPIIPQRQPESLSEFEGREVAFQGEHGTLVKEGDVWVMNSPDGTQYEVGFGDQIPAGLIPLDISGESRPRSPSQIQTEGYAYKGKQGYQFEESQIGTNGELEAVHLRHPDGTVVTVGWPDAFRIALEQRNAQPDAEIYHNRIEQLANDTQPRVGQQRYGEYHMTPQNAYMGLDNVMDVVEAVDKIHRGIITPQEAGIYAMPSLVTEALESVNKTIEQISKSKASNKETLLEPLHDLQALLQLESEQISFNRPSEPTYQGETRVGAAPERRANENREQSVSKQVTTIPNENQIQETSRLSPIDQSITPLETPTEQVETGTPLRSREGEEVITKEQSADEAWANSKEFEQAESAALRGDIDEALSIEEQFKENYAKQTPEPVARPEAKPIENAPAQSRKVSPKPESEPIRSEQAVESVGKEVASFHESLNRSSEEVPVAATLKTPSRGDIPVEILGKEGQNFVYRNVATGDTGRWKQSDIADLSPREAKAGESKRVRSKKIVAEKKAEAPKVEEIPKNESVKSDEPPLKEGHVRLYRAEMAEKVKGKRPEWMEGDEKIVKSDAASNRWFYSTRKEAEDFAKDFVSESGAKSKITYVDVPKESVDSLRVRNDKEAKRFSAAGRHDEELFVPREIADSRKNLVEPPSSVTNPREVFAEQLLKDLPEAARAKWTPEERELAGKAAEGDADAFDALPRIKQNAVARFIAEQGISVDYIQKNGPKNKLVDWADKVLNESKKSFNLSVNPELFAAYAVKGAELVSKGFTTFKAWSNRMLSKFGQGIKSYLNDLWAVAQSKKGALDIGGGKKPEPEGKPAPEQTAKSEAKPKEEKAPWVGKEPEVKPPDNPVEQPQSEAPTKFSSYVDDVDDWRKKRNLPELPEQEKVNEQQWLKAGLKHLETNPEAAGKLADSLVESPRPITDAEAAILTVHIKKLSDSFDENWRIANDPKTSPEQVKEAQLRNALIVDDLDKIQHANNIMRSDWGKRGYLLKQQLEQDYSLSAMIRKRTTEKLGEKPTGDELKKIEEQADAIKKLQTELEALRTKRDEAGEIEAADDKFKELGKSVARRKGRGEKADTEDLLQKEFAHIEDKTKLPTQKQLELLARYHVENGVRNVDELISTMKADLKKRGYDEFSDSQIRTGLSSYGSTKQLSQEEVDKALRDLKGQSRLLEQLKDAKEGVMPKLTGMLRDKPTEEQRRLMKEVNDEISKQELSRKTPEEQRASRLDQVKTRLNNLIEELQKDIEKLKKGETINNRVRTAVERDTEANRLQKTVDELRKERDTLQPKKELTEEQWNKNMIAVANRMQREFERRLAEKDFAVKKRGDHKASLELEQARAERDAAKEEMMADEDYKKSAEERAIATILRRKEKQIERYETKIANKEYEPKPRKPAPQDKRIDELDLEIRKVKNQFMMDQAAARRANRTKWQRFWDSIPEAKRAMVLSSPAVIGKLGAAGFVRNVMSGAEEVVGKGLERILPKAVLEKATLEGKSDIGALAKGVKEGYSKWGQDIKDIYKIGKTDIDLKYGDKKTYDENGLGTWFGRMHYIMKAPAKRAAFRSASIRLAKKYAAEGHDITSDVMQAKIGTEAYKHAQNAIFMGDNVVGKMFNQAIAAAERDKGDAGAGIARTLKTLFPIVKVPLNIASESFVTAFGGVTGALKLAQVYRKGIEKLTPEEADMIVRHFKKGSIGAGAMLLGFLAKDSVGGFYEDKEKRKLGEIGAHKFRIFGEDVPSWLAHAPIFEVMQMGATIRRTMEHKNKEGEAKGVAGIPAGLLASIVGIAEETPFMNEMFRTKELQSPEGREKFLGELAKSQLEPLLLQQIAAQLDKTPMGETVKRNPEGIVETMMSGIPGLRNKLAVKITDALPPSEAGHIPEPIKKYAMAGGLMPSKPEKGVLLHKNPKLSDEQFEKYAEIRGKYVKEALLRSVSRLSRLDEDSQRNAIRTISQNASDMAKRKLNLRA